MRVTKSYMNYKPIFDKIIEECVCSSGFASSTPEHMRGLFTTGAGHDYGTALDGGIILDKQDDENEIIYAKDSNKVTIE